MNRAAAVLVGYRGSDKMPDNSKRNTELLSEFSAGYTAQNEATAYFGSDCRLPIGERFADTVSISALAALVLHVVEMRAEEKVRRIDARGVVARMADSHSFGDRAVMDLPRQPVRFEWPTGMEGGHLPIAIGVQAGSPKPARFGLIDVRPEPIPELGFGPLASHLHGARTRATGPRSAIEVRAIDVKSRLADRASHLNRGLAFFGRLRVHLLTPVQWVPRPGLLQQRPGISSSSFYQMGVAG